MAEPKVFISYSHDSAEHKKWVLQLATDLRTNGVDATIDQWDVAPGQDLASYMHNGIIHSDRVLLICTDTYVDKAEKGTGGVGYERLIVTAELVQNIDTKKFIPLIRGNSSRRIPAFFGPRVFVDFNNDSQYSGALEQLLRELLGAPAATKPPLGKNPFSGAPPTGGPVARDAGPTGLTKGGTPVLDDQWFKNHQVKALDGLAKLERTAYMELRFGLHESVNKSQIELLNAVRQSEIRTFGWPIGITLENREEYRPRPFEDGVRAEIAIGANSLSGRTSYDYWALRSNGDFYLLQDLFEDGRDPTKIFFNTRIVRVAESLLFARNLYSNLGAAHESRASIRVLHQGFAGRILGTSNPNRHIFPHTAQESRSQTEIVVEVGDIGPKLVDEVKRITAPMFMLFDFMEFEDSVYEDIVRRFEKGEVT